MGYRQDLLVSLQASAGSFCRQVFPVPWDEGTWAYLPRGGRFGRAASKETTLAAACRDVLREAGLTFTKENLDRIRVEPLVVVR